MSKKLTFNEEARSELLSGAEQLANAVTATLGPKGRTVVLEKSFGLPVVTKDGVSVAKEISLEDAVQNMGAQMIKEAASQANDEAGDGTTTATVLAYAILKEGHRQIANGANPVEVKRGIDKAVRSIVNQLEEYSKEVKDNAEIAQVGTISANNDEEIGSIIAEAMEKVGREGIITVEEGKTADTTLEVVEGMQFDRGYASPYFITNPQKQLAELSNPKILLYDSKIVAMKDLLPILEKCVQTDNPMLIIAEEVEGEALATLVVNSVRGTLKVCTVKAPGFGEQRTANLEDIAALTGGTVITDKLGVKLSEVTMDMLGSCEKVVVEKGATTIVNGSGASEDIKTRIMSIATQIEGTSSSYEKEKLQMRLAKLSGGVALIKIGAHSEIEMKEKKDRIEDALNATRAAVEEGVIPGGGIALMKCSDAFACFFDNDDQSIGGDIIIDACKAPFNSIMTNAGLNAEVIWNEVNRSKTKNAGYDARNEEVVDMFKSGIIDPVKVTRIALEKAASVAGTMLTTECVVTNIKKEETPAQPQHPMM